MSIAIKINGGGAGVKAVVAANGAVVATLESTAGVRSCDWSIVATDELKVAGDYTFTKSGSVGQTYTGTATATVGTAGTLKAVVNSGLSSVTGDYDEAATTAYCKFEVLAANGLEVLCSGEQSPTNLVSNPTHGAIEVINEAIRSIGTLGPTGTAHAAVRLQSSGVAEASALDIANDGSTTVTIDGLATTPTPGTTLKNTTVATGGASVQVSPSTKWSSQVWDTNKGGGGDTATLDLAAHCLPVSGATNVGKWVLTQSIDGGAPAEVFRVGKGRGTNPVDGTMAHIALLGTELINFDGSNTTLGVTGNPTYIDGGAVNLRTASGTMLRATAATIALFGGTPHAQQAITGALSTVVDAAAKAVLTSIIAALAPTAGIGAATDGTT